MPQLSSFWGQLLRFGVNTALALVVAWMLYGPRTGETLTLTRLSVPTPRAAPGSPSGIVTFSSGDSPAALITNRQSRDDADGHGALAPMAPLPPPPPPPPPPPLLPAPPPLELHQHLRQQPQQQQQQQRQ
eukprot:RCo026753